MSRLSNELVGEVDSRRDPADMAINYSSAPDVGSARSGRRELIAGLAALLPAAPLAFSIHSINQAFAGRPERALLLVGAFFAALLILPPIAYLAYRGRRADPGRLALILLADISILLVSTYLYWVSFYVSFPADILIWSEGDFVNDILKFRVGYPIYSAEANNESFHYTPGAQLLTYLLAWLIGKGTSIPVYRAIQVGYTLLAAAVALCCWRDLTKPAVQGPGYTDRWPWGIICLPLLFLIATNSLTNPYVHNLHNDALAQLVSAVGYYLLLRYALSQDKRILAMMALIPTVGFLVKQSLAIWAAIYCLHLAFFDRPRSIARLAIFAAVAFGGVGAAVAAGYLLWGDHFIYWAFTVLAKHSISPLRSFKHVLDVWPYFAIGLLGGLVLLRGKSFALLLGPWTAWLFLISVEAYTSGVGWMLNHIGPGCLIAGIWFLAALTKLWLSGLHEDGKFRPQAWLAAGISAAIVVLLLNGLGIVRIPMRPLSKDAYRYIAEIEREFQSGPAEKILLDVGSWVYLKEGVVMKDRAPAIGERGYTGTGDFSGIIGRLRERHYSKILVRNLNEPDFWYDYWLWSKPSGIRRALLENYSEVGGIRAVKSVLEDKPDRYGFGKISILVPKSDRDR